MKLQELEARLKALIEVQLINILPGQKAEDLIVQKLTAAMRSNHTVLADGTRVAPNHYTLMANADSLARWRDPQILETLIEILKTSARETKLHFDIPPTIMLAEDANLLPGDFSLLASHRAESMEETKDMQTTNPESEQTETIPENAFLIVEGVKVFPLREAVINIGRRLDNTLVLDDPRVSRNHAQLRAIKGRYVIFDLNSTGGTFVNGQRASQSVLYAGDVISLAGVSLIFGQDNPPPRPDLAETNPFNEASADRPTAIIKTMPPTKKKKK